MKTMYCVTFIDNSSNDMNNNWRMVTGINSNGVETTPDYDYNMTIEEAEAQLANYEEIAKQNGWDWASFQIEDNEWMINEIGRTKYYICGGRNNESYFITESDVEAGGFVDFVDEDFVIDAKEEADKILANLKAYEEEIGVDNNLHIETVNEI